MLLGKVFKVKFWLSMATSKSSAASLPLELTVFSPNTLNAMFEEVKKPSLLISDVRLMPYFA